MGRALCAPPESLAGGSCLTSPPSSHFPPALCSQQEQRVQGLLGVGSGEGALGLESAVRMHINEKGGINVVCVVQALAEWLLKQQDSIWLQKGTLW